MEALSSGDERIRNGEENDLDEFDTDNLVMLVGGKNASEEPLTSFSLALCRSTTVSNSWPRKVKTPSSSYSDCRQAKNLKRSLNSFHSPVLSASCARSATRFMASIVISGLTSFA
jgi:hypothetical protein